MPRNSVYHACLGDHGIEILEIHDTCVGYDMMLDHFTTLIPLRVLLLLKKKKKERLAVLTVL